MFVNQLQELALKPIELETPRLKLRQWQPDDYPAFAAMTADPQVMRYFPAVLSQEESNQMADKLAALITEKGWGFWAVEQKQRAEFIGFVGLHEQTQQIPGAPFIEIGWRLSRQYWRQGYAAEAANRALAFAFDELKQSSVYAFTTKQNLPSRGLMEKLGLLNTGQDFNHPALDSDHPLKRHCLYQITESEWRRLNDSKQV